jgi:hypothetical protein
MSEVVVHHEQLKANPGARRIRAREILFTINLSLTGVSALVLHNVFVPFVRFARAVNGWFGKSSMDPTGGYLAFSVYVCGLTIVISILLRLLSVALIERILRWTGGITALVAAPVSWFYIVRWHGWYPIEVGVYLLLYVILYSLRRRNIFFLVTAALAAVHFGFWTLRFWEYTHNIVEALVPIVGYCSYLAWAAYIKST